MPAALIPSTGPVLAEVPAAALAALSALAPKEPAGLAAVMIRPAGPDRVRLEVFGRYVAGSLELAGIAARPVSLHPWVGPHLHRRQRDAGTIRVETGPGGGYLRVLAAGLQSACAVACAEAEPLPELPAWEPGPPAEGLLLDPALLSAALAALREACPGPVQLTPLSHEVLGLELSPLSPEVFGGIALARMARL